MYSLFFASFPSFLLVLNFKKVESKADLTEEMVIAKLRAAGGAHQPTKYEFSEYSEYKSHS